VPREKIRVSDANIRKSIDDVLEGQNDEFEALVGSIRARGVLQPVILVRKGDWFDLVVGQCRFLAAQRAQLKVIPAMVYEKMSEATMREISTIENLQRIELDRDDIAAALDFMIRETGSPTKVAERLHRSERWVRYNAGWFGIPEGVRSLVRDGKLTQPDAVETFKPLTKWMDAKDIEDVAKDVADLRKSNRKAYEKAIRIIRKQKGEINTRSLKAALRRRESPATPIRIYLSDTERDALSRAADEYGAGSPEDLAHTVINDWLKSKRFI
jgi:ParB/RepB/Spo0J family partition protein